MKSPAVSATRRPRPSTKAPPPPARRAAASAPAKAKVRETERHVMCLFSQEGIGFQVMSPSSVASYWTNTETHKHALIDTHTHTLAQTKPVTCTGMLTIPPTERKLLSCCSVCVSPRVLICFSSLLSNTNPDSTVLNPCQYCIKMISQLQKPKLPLSHCYQTATKIHD